MVTSFKKIENCNNPNSVGGAKRDPLKTPTILKEQDEVTYAENSYEASLNYEEELSSAKLAELDRRAKELLKGSVPNEDRVLEGGPSISCKKPKDLEIHHAFKISCSGVTQSLNTKEFSMPMETGIPIDDEPNINGSNNNTNQENRENREDLRSLGLRSQRHPNTIRKYIAVLLAFFSNLETEYVNEDGLIFVRKIPVFYASREKLLTIEQHELEALTNGNTNSLPRGALILDSLTYDSTRQLNKGLTVNSVMTEASLARNNPYAEVTPAPSPYQIAMRLTIMCRGMSDAVMLAEQIGSFFNPFYNIPMTEGTSGEESAVRLKLEAISFEPPEYDEFSNNTVIMEASFVLYGNLYKPTYKEYLAKDIVVSYAS